MNKYLIRVVAVLLVSSLLVDQELSVVIRPSIRPVCTESHFQEAAFSPRANWILNSWQPRSWARRAGTALALSLTVAIFSANAQQNVDNHPVAGAKKTSFWKHFSRPPDESEAVPSKLREAAKRIQNNLAKNAWLSEDQAELQSL